MSQRRPKDRSHWGDAAFAAARAARNPPSDEQGYPAGCAKCAEMREALRQVDAMLDAFPAGVDELADPDNPSPEDAEAHTAGLIRQVIRAALETK